MSAARTVSQADVDANRATPGSQGGKVDQEPLRTVGPRDALIPDGNEAYDYVPDVERLHVGLVKQPALPVRDRAGNITGWIEASDIAETLQLPPKEITLADLKAAHNKSEQTREWQRHIRPVGPSPLGEEDSADYNDGSTEGRAGARRKAVEARAKEPKASKAKDDGNGDPDGAAAGSPPDSGSAQGATAK